MIGGLKKLRQKKKGTPERPSPVGLQGVGANDMTATQRLHKSLASTKSMLWRKMGASSDIAALPADFEAQRNNLRLLLPLFEDLVKLNQQYTQAMNEEGRTCRQMASALSNFSSPISKTEASKSLGMCRCLGIPFAHS